MYPKHFESIFEVLLSSSTIENKAKEGYFFVLLCFSDITEEDSDQVLSWDLIHHQI